MKHSFSLVKPIETEQTDCVKNNNQNYFPESAKTREKAIKHSSTAIAILIYGGLCAKFGLILATLMVSGIACILIPVSIYILQKKHIWEAFYYERILGIKIPEIVAEFETDYQFIIMKDKLQLVAANQFPRFFRLRNVRIFFNEVPNGIEYDVIRHHWDDGNEFIELTLSNKESLAKAWDKKLRAALLRNPRIDTSVELHYQE